MRRLLVGGRKHKFDLIIRDFCEKECNNKATLFAQKTKLRYSTAQRLLAGTGVPHRSNFQKLVMAIPKMKEFRKELDSLPINNLSYSKELGEDEMSLEQFTELVDKLITGRVEALETSTHEQIRVINDRLKILGDSVNTIERGGSQRDSLMADRLSKIEAAIEKLLDGKRR